MQLIELINLNNIYPFKALIREVKEETGLTVIPESIKELGLVVRLNKSFIYQNTVMLEYLKNAATP